MAKKIDKTDEQFFGKDGKDIIEEKEAWENFPDESFKKAGDINPVFSPWLNTVYTIKLLTKPKPVETSTGDAFVVDIELDGMKRSLFATGSFNFHLAKIKRDRNWKNSDLIGKSYLLQKTKGYWKNPNTGAKEETNFLSLQLIE